LKGIYLINSVVKNRESSNIQDIFVEFK